jgi:GINS complex subunit 2
MASNVLREIYNQDASEFERLSNLDLNKQSTAAAFQVDNVKRTKISDGSSVTRSPQKETVTKLSSIKTLPTSSETLTPVDCHFLAENCQVKIIPKFSTRRNEEIELMCQTLPNFRAAHSTQVPLWTALSLKRQRKCKLEKPDWMDVDRIELQNQEEQNTPMLLPPLHKHYREISDIILNQAIDDIENADEIRTCVKDLWDTRKSKIVAALRTGIINKHEMEEDPKNPGEVRSSGKVDERQPIFGKLPNITPLEICMIRESLVKTLNIKHVLLKYKFDVDYQGD